jgi:hypothetical protein
VAEESEGRSGRKRDGRGKGEMEEGPGEKSDGHREREERDGRWGAEARAIR